ncbi:MAG: hypothetical protein ACRCR2_02635 [Fusobacteriaceae bacterium]
MLFVVLAMSCSTKANTTSWSVAQRWNLNKNNVLNVPAHSESNKRMGVAVYLSDDKKDYNFYFMYLDVKCNPKTFKNENQLLNVDDMVMEFTAFCTPTKRMAYHTISTDDNLTLFMKFMMQRSVTVDLTTYSTRGFIELANKQLSK